MNTATITFIGLFVFSYQFTPGQTHLQALAPRITSAALVGQNTGATAIVDPAVGEHATYIAFAKKDYVPRKGWVPQELPTNRDFYYVRLDGEQVEFTGATLAGPKAADGLRLPHLATCCADGKDDRKPTLKKEFRPPFSGAAAVFDLRAGRVQNCNGVIDGQATDRADTVVQIDTNASLTISAKLRGKRAKQIVLLAGAQVLVANLPIDAIGGPAVATTSPHFNAYYAMMERARHCTTAHHCVTTTSSLSVPCERLAIRPTTATARVSGRQTAEVLTADSAPRFTVLANELANFDVNNQDPMTLDSQLRINFECSNSQWP